MLTWTKARPPAAAGDPRGVLHPRGHDLREGLHEAAAPGFWDQALALRILIAAVYVSLVPIGVLPMAAAWWIASAWSLLLYAVAVYVSYRVMGVSRLLTDVAPFIDIAFVTLAIIAVARPEYPIWMGYVLTVPTTANFHGTRYVIAFSVLCGALCFGAFAALEFSSRIAVDWPLAVVLVFMTTFASMEADTVAASNRRLRARVREASLTDPLTGLANRRRFREVLECHDGPQEVPLAVLMYDLDDFKQINESRGHLHADGVLVRVAGELERCFREADTVARYGGDELIVLAHVGSIEDALSLAQRSVRHVQEEVGVTLSCGVAVYPLSAASLEAALIEADQALGRAKRAGKARAAA
jgi:diguanylate cyclase (GGDEF)-like protein